MNHLTTSTRYAAHLLSTGTGAARPTETEISGTRDDYDDDDVVKILNWKWKEENLNVFSNFLEEWWKMGRRRKRIYSEIISSTDFKSFSFHSTYSSFSIQNEIAKYSFNNCVRISYRRREKWIYTIIIIIFNNFWIVWLFIFSSFLIFWN